MVMFINIGAFPLSPCRLNRVHADFNAHGIDDAVRLEFPRKDLFDRKLPVTWPYITEQNYPGELPATLVPCASYEPKFFRKWLQKQRPWRVDIHRDTIWLFEIGEQDPSVQGRSLTHSEHYIGTTCIHNAEESIDEQASFRGTKTIVAPENDELPTAKEARETIRRSFTARDVRISRLQARTASLQQRLNESDQKVKSERSAVERLELQVKSLEEDKVHTEQSLQAIKQENDELKAEIRERQSLVRGMAMSVEPSEAGDDLAEGVVRD